MLRFIFALSFLVVALVATSQPEDESHQLPKRSPFYPISSYFRDLSAPGHRRDPRLIFWTWTVSTSFTTTTTTTSTTTCTLSTSSTCTGRRRRWIEYPEDEEPIAPSAVAKVEATPVAEMGPTRETREADPQYYGSYPYYFPQSGFYQQQQQPNYGIHSTFDGPYSYNYPGLSYYLGSGNAYDQQQNYGYLPYNPAAFRHGSNQDDGQEAAFKFLWNTSLYSSIFSTFTFTHTVRSGTSTIFTETTVTSTPTCSTAGTLAQCPTG